MARGLSTVRACCCSAALDAKLREEVPLELINLQREVGITFVFVIHAQTDALVLSHMSQGRLEQVNKPSKLYGFPKDCSVADFIGHINQLEARVVESSHGHGRDTKSQKRY